MKKYLGQIKQYRTQELIYLYNLRKTIEENPRLYNDFMEEALEVGVLKRDKYDKIIRRDFGLEVVRGLLMEAFIVSKANNDINVLKSLFKAACKRTNLPHDSYVTQFEAIGTGFLSTKQRYPHFYNPNDNSDILFLRHMKNKRIDPAHIIKSNHYANIQVKAITSENSLYNDIVRPLINEKYSSVLTCLRFDKDIHTKEKCYDIISDLKDGGKVTIFGQKHSFNKDVRKRIMDSIYCPEDICIDQNEIDDYCEFIKAWFYGEQGLKAYQFYDNINLALNLLHQRIIGYRNSFTFKIKEVPI